MKITTLDSTGKHRIRVEAVKGDVVQIDGGMRAEILTFSGGRLILGPIEPERETWRIPHKPRVLHVWRKGRHLTEADTCVRKAKREATK